MLSVCRNVRADSSPCPIQSGLSVLQILDEKLYVVLRDVGLVGVPEVLVHLQGLGHGGGAGLHPGNDLLQSPREMGLIALVHLAGVVGVVQKWGEKDAGLVGVEIVGEIELLVGLGGPFGEHTEIVVPGRAEVELGVSLGALVVQEHRLPVVVSFPHDLIHDEEVDEGIHIHVLGQVTAAALLEGGDRLPHVVLQGGKEGVELSL